MEIMKGSVLSFVEILSIISRPAVIYGDLERRSYLGLLSWQAIIYSDVVKSRIQSDDPANPKYKGKFVSEF